MALYYLTGENTTAVGAAVNIYFPQFLQKLVFYSARFSRVYIRQYT